MVELTVEVDQPTAANLCTGIEVFLTPMCVFAGVYFTIIYSLSCGDVYCTLFMGETVLTKMKVKNDVKRIF